ncbi:MAG: hypothetical protein O2955_00515 [Planctomycetota bacterium]|nr:hypothetical protein [Planctomycetota bacterium]MDA1210963.1 hypothetical protein [Planctomycetota bacterium]
MSDNPKEKPIDIPRQPLFVRLLRWRFVIPAAVIVGLIVSPFAYFQHLVNQIPDIGDPFDVEAFGTVKIVDEENGWLDYEAAYKMLTPLPDIPGRDIQKEYDEALDNGWQVATDVIREWVADNRPALARWKQGTEKPDFLIQQPKDLHFGLLIPDVQAFREIARLSQLEWSRLLIEGNVAEAWIGIRTLYRSSRQFVRHGTPMQRMLGAVYLAISIKGLEDLTQHPATTETMLHEILDEVHRTYRQTPPKSVFVKCDYWEYQNLLKKPDEVAGILKPGKKDTPVERLLVWFVVKFGFEPQMAQRLAPHFYARTLDQIDLPVKDRQPWTGTLTMFSPDPKQSYPAGILSPTEINEFYMQSILARSSLRSCDGMDQTCLREESRQYAVELWLALQIYERQNGKYPDTLSELVAADIIDSLPVDPFSRTGASMQYRRDGDGAIIWGVGENYIDDGGLIGIAVNNEPSDIGMRLGNDSVAAKKP